MLPRCLLLVFVSVLLCQCKSQRTVEDDGIQGARLGFGDEAIKEKFAGNWKPEDASWYSAQGETDKKKRLEAEKKIHRSPFENSVNKSREEAMFSKSTKWQERSVYHKEFDTGKDKKKFSWPWEKKTANTKSSDLMKVNQNQERVSREASMSARETDREAKQGDQVFGTREFQNREEDVKKKGFWKTEQESSHRQPEIIVDRDKPDKDASSWSVSDVRRLLNKN